MKIKTIMMALGLLALLGLACLHGYAASPPDTAGAAPPKNIDVVHEVERPVVPAPEPEFHPDERIPLEADLQEFVTDVCEAYGIRPSLIYGMIRQESDFRADLVCDKGRSVGLMQIQRRWHEGRMDKVGATDLYDPYDNVAVGIDLIVELLRGYNGDEVRALTAYNRGVVGANRYFAKGNTTSAYAEKVLKYAREYEKEDSDDGK